MSDNAMTKRKRTPIYESNTENNLINEIYQNDFHMGGR
jgi:hypothetical protein